MSSKALQTDWSTTVKGKALQSVQGSVSQVDTGKGKALGNLQTEKSKGKGKASQTDRGMTQSVQSSASQTSKGKEKSKVSQTYEATTVKSKASKLVRGSASHTDKGTISPSFKGTDTPSVLHEADCDAEKIRAGGKICVLRDKKSQNAFGYKLRTSPLEVKMQWAALKAKSADVNERQDFVEQMLAVRKGDFSGFMKRKQDFDIEAEVVNHGEWVSYEVAKSKEGKKKLLAMVRSRTIPFKDDLRVTGMRDIVFPENQLFYLSTEKRKDAKRSVASG